MTAPAGTRYRLKSPDRGVTGRISGRVPVIACLVIILSSPSALATCGDYLFRNGRSVVFHDVRSGETQGAAAELMAPGLPVNESAPLPFRCHGANCSQAPVPVPPIPAAVRVISDSAILLDLLPGCCDSFRAFALPRSERAVKCESSPPFRPPETMIG